MPIKYFTDSFRERLNNFPDEIQHQDMITFFTLSESDQDQIPIRSAPYNRLGFALQLCTLRFMGFVPDELTRTPPAVVEYLAHQLNIDPSVLSEYPTRVQTRNDHLTRIMEYFDIRKASEKDVEEVTSWLIERALEHDKPSLLYELICDKLRADKIIRPGITSLERIIAEARHKAETETLLRLEPILTDECKSLLDSLLVSERERTLLSQLRQRANSNSPPSILRNMWLDKSRHYANPETYLIPRDQWPKLRPEVCRQISAPQDGATRLKEREVELEGILTKVDTMLSNSNKVRIDNGELVVSPLEAEERPESVAQLEACIDRMLPRVQITNLLIEVDNWTKFSKHFVHPSFYEPQGNEFLQNLYASILAQGCNIDFARMALSASLSDDRLLWLNNWYIREETLRAATDELVNFHYHQPLSHYWGGGTLSSSDGQRFPASGKVRIAEALPKYFGYGKGVTFYTWTSDQYSQYGTKVIPATVRDATYVLDERATDNETELSIMEHTTDTMGYTEIVFALFDLLGMQFSPRIRDLGNQHLYQINPQKRYPNLQPLLKGNIKRDIILKRWDDFLRVAGSLKMGWVTASLFIRRILNSTTMGGESTSRES